ncbi:MAG: TMEM175 family protein [Acidobacteriia bacterium]|nr:TMEM175 family protein [Terriglobia bacterium]
MSKGRLEAFSDGVIAIVITIMVLELKIPDGADAAALRAAAPAFLMYTLSFIFLGIYWNNHHHMLHATTKISGAVLWANLHLLFWLSIVPVVTAWMGRHYQASLPTAVYGVVLILCAAAYTVLVNCIIAVEGPHSKLARAIGRDVKGWISLVLYAIAIGVSFVSTVVADGLYVTVALIWLVPDRRIEKTLA